MVKVFLTGATGYIGGTAHAYIVKHYPDWEYTLFVRNEERAKAIKAKYPNSKFVYGSLSDGDIIEKAASEADVVVHTADSADDVTSAEAIGRGLKKGHTASNPGYWIHTSGTGILLWYDLENKRTGEAPLPEQKYADIDGIDRVVSLPDGAPHRNVDKIVQSYISDAVKVAIIAPPTIYGTGSGQVNTRSIQTPQLAQATLEKGFGLIIGAGKTEWDNIHVDDLGEVFAKLAGASQDPSKNSNPEIFGPKAYFFVENGHHLWADVATWIAEEASRQGYLPEALTKTVTQQEANNTGLFASVTWGANSKGVAQRARKYLDWTPRAVSYKDTIAELVTKEAKALGLTPKEKKG